MERAAPANGGEPGIADFPQTAPAAGFREGTAPAHAWEERPTHHAKDALQVPDQRLRAALEHAATGLLVTDRDLRIVEVNPHLLELSGHPAVELLGMEVTRLTHPEDQDAELAIYRDLLSNHRRSHRYEKRLLRRDGDVTWVQVSLAVHADDSGIPEQVIALCHDITRSRIAEESLLESDARFQTIARATSDVVWDWDIRRDRLWWNDNLEAAFGYPPGSLHRGSGEWLERVHPDDRSALQQGLQRCLDSEEVRWSATYRFRRRDGHLAYVLDRGFVIRDGNGEPIRMIGSMIDISDRMRIEESLRRNEELYRVLFDANPMPLWIYDTGTLRFLEVNQAALEQYGYAREEFLSLNLADLRPPEDVPAFVAMFREGSHPPDEPRQSRHRKKDGTVIHVETIGRPVTFRGRPARLVLTHDITARLLDQEKISEQAALLNEISDPIILCDAQHRVRFWGRGAERLYGWSAAEVQGRHVLEFLTHDPGDFQRARTQLMAKGSWQGEVTHSTRAGDSIIVLGRWTLLADDRNGFRGILAIYTDITERKQLESRFLRAQRLESIGTLAGGIAHDLNNVLSPILMGSELLRLMVSEPEAARLVDTIQSTARRGSSLIRQVLAFARGVDGKRILVDPVTLLREIDRILGETFPRNIEFRLRITEPVASVIGDPTQLHQVLLNLCVNARDAMPHGGMIEISVTDLHVSQRAATAHEGARPGAHVRLSVRDTGTGIPPAIRDRIFEPFFTTKDIGQGTGLGLATVLAIVRGHGGFLTLDTEVGRGTTFHVFLPAAQGAAECADAARVDPPCRGRGETVLVVDDEPVINALTRQTLASHGYNVLSAANGDEALQVFESHGDPIDAVVTDIMMPGMDGPMLIKALRRKFPRLPIIAVSGLSQPAMDGAGPASPDVFLQKPFSGHVLLRNLRTLLDQAS